MAFKDLSPSHKVTSVHLDIMRHKDFALMGGVTQIGKVIVAPAKDMPAGIPTAATDGCDVFYAEEFIEPMTRKQLRYLVLHENWHKGLHHCSEYPQLKKKYPELSSMAVDYVVNGMIEAIDPTFEFVERPTLVPPLVDKKFADMSYPEVLKALLDEQKENEKNGKGQGKGKSGSGRGAPMDVHMVREKGEGDEGEGDVETDGPGAQELRRLVQDAINQGAIVRNKLRGEGGGGNALGGFQDRNTDWRTPLRRFVQDVCEGDDQSRFSPPNKRMLPLGIILPSHFSEATGELIVACDTSGSMHGLYATVFGEIARICQNANPAAVRVIWWGDHIEGEQVFAPKDYPSLATLLKPLGGGGTTVSCVARHITQKKYKPKAVIILTDGYIESSYECPSGPLLWGVVDNSRFVPIKGKKIDINSMLM